MPSLQIGHFKMTNLQAWHQWHLAFRRQNQISFLEAHIAAFHYFGGVFKRIRYDNLTSAVKKVLRGRKRVESDRFIALRSHYLFESEFCLPGIQGAHEKGGVEGGVGRFRRNHLAPVPQVADMMNLNQLLSQACKQDDERVISGQTESVKARWQIERVLLKALPSEPFQSAELCKPIVNPKSLARVKGNDYSVPVMYVGQEIEAQVEAEKITFWKKGHCIAQHTRSYAQHQIVATLDHYLLLLKQKPGALAGSAALSQCRSQQRWPIIYDQYWQQLLNHYGPSEGNRRMVDYLWWARDFDLGESAGLLEKALNLGCDSLESLQCLLRQQQPFQSPAQLPADLLGKLIQYERPMSQVNHYDQLLANNSGERV